MKAWNLNLFFPRVEVSLLNSSSIIFKVLLRQPERCQKLKSTLKSLNAKFRFPTVPKFLFKALPLSSPPKLCYIFNKVIAIKAEANLNVYWWQGINYITLKLSRANLLSHLTRHQKSFYFYQIFSEFIQSLKQNSSCKS